MFQYSKLLQGNILKVCPAVKFKIGTTTGRKAQLF